jgi:hypothetical protein
MIVPFAEPAGLSNKVFIYPLDHLRPGIQFPMKLTFTYPKGHAPFQVVFNVDANEIKPTTPLGGFIVIPRQPTN